MYEYYSSWFQKENETSTLTQEEIKDYLNGKTTLTIAKELITLRTRQYAKRQFTWSRGHMKSWEMIYSSNINDLFPILIISPIFFLTFNSVL